MSLKVVDEKTIKGQKEISLQVDNMLGAKKFLEKLGCKCKAYQETKREIWQLDEAEITIDTWPFLETFLEIEGKNEKIIRKTTKQLGLDYKKALFCSITTLYRLKYNLSDEVINHLPKIIFGGRNPFIG